MQRDPSSPVKVHLRADAQLNRIRVLEGARLAFASGGLDVSYHEVARLAGVGVGTVYRRYPDRNRLLQAVLGDILDELTAKAEAAGMGADRWGAFAGFFTDLSAQTRRHAGLSERLGGRGGEPVAAARDRLLRAVDALCDRARAAGLRDDVDRHDVLFLAQLTAGEGCGLDLEIHESHRIRAVDIILAGLRR